MSRLTEEEVAKAIYPVGFYRTKAKNVSQTCKKLVESFSSAVPDNLEDLMTLPGVGRKTANLVLSLGFGGPGLCVGYTCASDFEPVGLREDEGPRRNGEKTPGEASPEVLVYLQHGHGRPRPEHLPSRVALLQQVSGLTVL